MPNYFSIGFFGLLACVGLGLDAQLQASRADKPVLEFGVSGYINSISARITQAKVEKTAAVNEKIRVSAWIKPTRDFLPEAPEGWQRRGFD